MNTYTLIETWDIAGIFTQEHQEPATCGFAPTRDEMTDAEHDFLVQNGRPDLVCNTTAETALDAIDYL